MEKRIFTDTSIPAYFQASGKPFKVISQVNTKSGQVEFCVEGENIDLALNELYANVTIGVLDYIKAFKSLRSSIFALKGKRR